MTFASEIAKNNSDRFTLVRVTPAVDITDDLAIVDSRYQATLPGYDISKIAFDGTDLTEEDGSTGSDLFPGLNKWSYVDGVLRINVNTTPSSFNPMILFYNLYFTTGKYRVATKNPDDSNTAEVLWEPRLKQNPAVKQSIRDTISGTLSTAITNIQLINSDNALNQHMSSKHSLNEKEVTCWICVNSTGNIQKLYRGKVKRVVLNTDSLVLSLYDMFSLLDQTALMGDTASDAYWIRKSGSFPDMDPQKSGTPIPMVLGPTQTRGTASVGTISSSVGPLSGGVYQKVVSNGIMKAVCTDFAQEVSSANNLVWGLCRLTSGGIKTRNGGTVELVDIKSENILLRVSNNTYKVGETFIWTEGGTTYKRLVVHSGYTTDGTNNFNLIIRPKGGETLTTSAVIEDSLALAVNFQEKNSESISTLLFQHPNFPTSDLYTVTQETLSSGNKYVYITLTSATLNGTILDPNAHDVIFTVEPADGVGHADVLKRLCEDAGLDVDATSFTDAQTALGVSTAFTIPQFDETEFNSYRKYCELILKSTMGILFAGNDFDLKYKILTKPSSSDVVYSNVYSGDFSVSVDYGDIVTQLVAYNSHYTFDEVLAAANSPSETAELDLPKYLHGVKNTNRFRHVLEEITSRIDNIFGVMSNPLVVYTIKTATKFLDAEIGDDIQIDSDRLLGTDTSKDLKIISIDKSADDVVIEATDLYDL